MKKRYRVTLTTSERNRLRKLVSVGKIAALTTEISWRGLYPSFEV